MKKKFHKLWMWIKKIFKNGVIKPIKWAWSKVKFLGVWYGLLAYITSQFLLWIPAIIPFIIGVIFDSKWGYGIASAYAIWVFAPTGTTFFYIPLLLFSIKFWSGVKKKRVAHHKKGGVTHEESKKVKEVK